MELVAAPVPKVRCSFVVSRREFAGRAAGVGYSAVVIGVSKDTCVSHAAFRDKYGISVRLLADVEGQLCDAYGVWQEKEKHGEKRMGIVRSTFVVDADGKIRHALYDVKPKGHAEQVLELVRGL